MNGTGKGSRISDIVVVVLFLLFLAWGGFHAWRAVTLISSMDVGEIDGASEMRQWEKSVREKIEGLFDSQKPKPAEPTATTGPAASPSSSASKAVVKKAELKTIKLYESNKEIPAVRSRVYATRFTPQARMVYVEFSYKNNNFQIADASVPVVIQYYGPAGQLLTEMKATAQPKKDWASALYTRGWGPIDGSPWPVGTYTVKVILDGDPAGEVTFDIR